LRSGARFDVAEIVRGFDADVVRSALRVAGEEAGDEVP